MNSGRTVGIILIVVGAVVAVLALAFFGVNLASGALTTSGAVLGAAIIFLVLVAPLVGFGIFMTMQGGKEAARVAHAEQQRELLDIVRSRGQVDIPNLAIEMQVSQEDLKAMVHQLVGLQVFSGYVNWDKGELYSAEARNLRELDKCKNCGGEITLAGKGVVTCRFCGTEYFLS